MKRTDLFYYALAAITVALAWYASNGRNHREETSSSSDATATCSDRDQACSATTTTYSPRHRGAYYCVNTSINSEYEILGNQDCFRDSETLVGDFVTPTNLPPGQVTPILWRNRNSNRSASDDNQDGGKIVSQYAFQISLPPTLVPTLLNYTAQLGIISKFQEFTTTQPIPALKSDSHNGKFLTFGNNRWYAQRPASKWASNMHWISPADERTHEEYLKVLFDGGFGSILENIGKAIQLDGLVAYHLTFLAVSNSVVGYTHHDTTATDGRVYNVIIPLLLEEDVAPELILLDDETEERGGYKYQVGMAALMGDDVIHGTLECDYTTERRGMSEDEEHDDDDDDGTIKKKRKEWKHGGIMANGQRSGMRLAATVYIADINDLNVKDVAEKTLTQIFPMADENWLFAQRGRHWLNDTDDDESNSEKNNDDDSDDESDSGPKKKKKKEDWIDKGRARFKFGDEEFEDCNIRAMNGMCESDEEETRKKCLKSCNIYIEDGPTSTKKLGDESDDDDEAMYYEVCTQNRTGVETCQTYQDDTDIDGDFVVPNKKLGAGEMFPIIWREDGSQTTPYAFQVGLPPELTTELLNYCNELGMTDLFRDLVGDNPIEALEDGQGPNGKFVTLADGNRWYAQRPEEKWTSNMHWIGPADEKTHEEYIKILAKGNFDAVLDGIGKYLGLESLAVYHLTFLAVSHSEKGYIHRDTHDTGGSVYNVIIPLILDDEALPELAMTDWWDESEMGSLKYQIGSASMMGDDAMHGTQACDYREKKGMRMAATVYIADINKANYKHISSRGFFSF